MHSFTMLKAGLFALCATGVLQAQGLLKDINSAPPTTDPSSSPTYITTVGPLTYFYATDGASGSELWVTAGTPASTKMIADIYPGTSSGSPLGFTQFGSHVYFSAFDALGRELWRTDGTAAGTTMVKDVYVGSSSSSPSNLTAAAGKLFFTGSDGTAGTELFISDGTAAGTVMVDIYPGTSSSSPSNLVSFAGKLFFTANDGTNGTELWTSDGTVAGTVMFMNIHPTSSSSPTYPAVLGTKLLFRATDGVSGIELWSTDGTVAGTGVLKDIYAGASSSSPAYLREANGKVWFAANDGAGAGTELWMSDGTAAGTVMVADIYVGASSSTPYHFVALGSKVVFSATNTGTGREPYITDGTAAGTTMLADLYSGTSSSISISSTYPGFYVAGGRAVFAANNGSTGTEPFVTDGTAAGTGLLVDIYPGTSSGALTTDLYWATNGPRVIFRGTESTTLPGRGAELWVSDGTVVGTTILNNLNVPAPSGSNPANFVELLGKSIFSATDGINGVELWSSDGTAAGTTMLKDIYAGASSSSPSLLTRIGDRVFFRANDGTSGIELWVTDGTAAGTTQVKDIYAGASSSSPNYLVNLGGKLMFSASDGTTAPGSGTELWISDGTAAGTVLLKDIYAGTSSSSPTYLTVLGDKVLFRASDGTIAPGSGTELWVSDGTAAGTVLLKDIYAGTSSGSPTLLREAGGKVWFYANDGALGFGSELWVSDGTAAGTMFVKDIYPGSSSSSPNNYTAIGGGKVIFDALDGTATTGTGREPWVTDGTAAGTMLLADIYPGTSSSSPSYLTELNGKGYFSALNATNGREVWMTDGTPAGTTILKDIWVGSSSGNTNPLIKLGNRILLCGDDGTTGYELYVTNGTAAGTTLVADLRPGALGALPYPFGTVGNRVLFSAFNDPVGEELFYVDHKTLGAGESDPFGTGCAGTNGIPVLSSNVPVLNGTFTMSLADGRASSPTVFVIGVGPTPTPVGGGCNLYVALSPVLSWTTLTNGSGDASVSLPVANDPNLLGFLTHAQNLTADPNGAWFNVLSFSNALKLVVGN